MATIKSIDRFIPTPPPQNIPGELQEWLREELDRIASAVNIGLDEIESSLGYGGIDNIQTIVNLNDIDTTPQVIQAAQGAVTTPIDVEQDVANNAVIFQVPGIWRWDVTLNLAFTDLNQGRIFQLQIYNATDDIARVTVDAFVGRNTDGHSGSISFMLTVGADIIGKQIQLRVLSANDLFTNVQQRRYVFHVDRIDRNRT